MKSKLADLLIRHDIIDSAAIEDPEGFDGGRTLRAVLDAEMELGQSEDVTPDKPGWYWAMIQREFTVRHIYQVEIKNKKLFNGFWFVQCRFRPCVNPFEGEGGG